MFPFTQSCDLIVAAYQLTLAGKKDSREYSELASKQEALWNQLNDAEQAWVTVLSSDLYEILEMSELRLMLQVERWKRFNVQSVLTLFEEQLRIIQNK